MGFWNAVYSLKKCYYKSLFYGSNKSRELKLLKSFLRAGKEALHQSRSAAIGYSNPVAAQAKLLP